MALSRAHTSANAADTAKLLLFNKRQVKLPTVAGYDSTPPNRNNNNNNRIYIAPYGRNFRGAGGRSDQFSVKA